MAAPLIIAWLAWQAAAPPAPLREMAPPGGGAIRVERILALCPKPPGATRSDLLSLELRQSDAAPLRGGAADKWTRLGCTRALLSLSDAFPREGARMPVGASWVTGALGALQQALDDHPADSLAASLLSVLAVSRTHTAEEGSLRREVISASRRGIHTPDLLRACAELALAGGQDSVARRCAEEDLRLGRDSTWQLLRLARLAFRKADTVAGSAAFELAAASARDSTDLDEVRWHLQWFLWPDELVEFPDIPREVRRTWMHARLASRDVRDGQPPGSRLAEHFRRLEYVLGHFWVRPSTLAFLRERLRSGRTGLALLSSSGGRADDVGGLRENMGSYQRWQTGIDDRGIVYMRLGEPTHRYYWGYSFARELWIYEIDGQRLFFNFQDEDHNGTTTATRLVTGTFSFFFCGIEPTRCSMGLNRGGSVEQQVAVTREDLAAQRVGTEMDDNSVRGAIPIRIAARYLRLWDPTDGEPLVLIPYAIRATDLVRTGDPTRPSATLQLALREWDGALNVERDSTFHRSVQFPAAVDSLTQLTGLILRRIPPTVESWSLIVTQGEEHRGRSWEAAMVPGDTGALRMSDLILGAEDQGLVWRNGATEVALAPLGNFDRARPVRLFFQVWSRMAIPDLRRTITLTRTDRRDRTGAPDLQVVTSAPVSEGLSQLNQELDVSRLGAGSYRVEVTLETVATGRRVHRTGALILR